MSQQRSRLRPTRSAMLALSSAIIAGWVGFALESSSQSAAAASAAESAAVTPGLEAKTSRPRIPHAAAPTPAAGSPVTQGRTLRQRDPREWQGMRVNLERQALCDGAASCGLAMACKSGQCGPCSQSEDCAEGESCVLDHCLRTQLASCSTRLDCAAHELCVLTGYSGGGTRNNENMRSVCMATTGGAEQREGQQTSAFGPPPEALVPEGPASSVDLAALQEEVEARMLSERTGTK